MIHAKALELLFFYSIIAASAYILYLMFIPYLTALLFAGLVVIILYPLQQYLLTTRFLQQPTSAAFLSTLVALVLIVLPLFLVISMLSKEVISLYDSMQNTEQFSIDVLVAEVETLLLPYFPDMNISVSDSVRALSGWGASQLQSVFSNSLAFGVSLLIFIMATFFFFRDGKRLVAWVITTSPLLDENDTTILRRIHTAIRSVLLGIAVVALLQGIVSALGFWLFGVPKPILWGTIATIGGLLPGLGTPVIMIPAIIYLWMTGHAFAAAGLLIWAALSVIIIDNILSPQLMARGNALHPLLILLSIIGGISLFGMIGVILGPVISSVFLVLLELQKKIVASEENSKSKTKVRHKKNS